MKEELLPQIKVLLGYLPDSELPFTNIPFEDMSKEKLVRILTHIIDYLNHLKI